MAIEYIVINYSYTMLYPVVTPMAPPTIEGGFATGHCSAAPRLFLNRTRSGRVGPSDARSVDPEHFDSAAGLEGPRLPGVVNFHSWLLKPWPSRNSGFTQLESLADLS